MTEHASAKLGNIRVIFLKFASLCVLQKQTNKRAKNKQTNKQKTKKLRITNSIFFLGHYLFLKAHSFPRGTISENCSLLGTGNVLEQINCRQST